MRSFNSSTSNLTNQIRQKLRELEKYKNISSISDQGGTGNIVNKQQSAIEDIDIERVLFLFDDEMPIDIEVWDQVKGQCQDSSSRYFFGQSYLQGKSGVVFLINPEQPTNSVAQTEQTIKSATENLVSIFQNCNVPIQPLYNKDDLFERKKDNGVSQQKLISWSDHHMKTLGSTGTQLKPLAFTNTCHALKTSSGSNNNSSGN